MGEDEIHAFCAEFLERRLLARKEEGDACCGGRRSVMEEEEATTPAGAQYATDSGNLCSRFSINFLRTVY